jgi:hypothetical protein
MKAPREKPSMLSKPMALVHSGPGKERIVAAQTGQPNMEPDTDTVSVADVLTGGGKTQLGAGGGNSATGNTAVVEVVTPGTGGAAGGSTVESTDTRNTPAPAAEGSAPATDTAAPGSDSGTVAPPAAGGDNAAAVTSGTGSDANASGSSSDPDAKSADNSNGKESTSKKKKGLRKVLPW